MGTLGTYLREAREARGLDLREAAQQTRISINYLRAIENEEFSRLPGEVFVRGFLKNYAKFLGLPEEDVIRRYGELKPPAPQEQAVMRTEAVKAAAEPAANRTGGLPARKSIESYLWGGLALFALLAVILAVWPESRGSIGHPGADVSLVTGTAETAGGPTATAAPATASDKLYLDIEAVEDTWVLVRTDASPQKQAMLKKGDIVTWSADERFLLSYGGIGSVLLRLNGIELNVEGIPGAVVRDLMVTSEGIVSRMVDVPRPAPKRRKRTPAPAPLAAKPAVVTTPASSPAPAPAAAMQGETPAATVREGPASTLPPTSAPSPDGSGPPASEEDSTP